VHKPRGVISDIGGDEVDLRTGELRRTVEDLLPPEHARVFPVGRLDLHSEGLVLLTDDGELANRLTHPRYQHPKTYYVLLGEQPSQEALVRLRNGVDLPEGRSAPAEVMIVGQLPATLRLSKGPNEGVWLRVVLREGKKRQIRHMTAAVGYPTLRLLRWSIGPLTLGDLELGQVRKLTLDEINALRKLAGLTPVKQSQSETPRQAPRSEAPAGRGSTRSSGRDAGRGKPGTRRATPGEKYTERGSAAGRPKTLRKYGLSSNADQPTQNEGAASGTSGARRIRLVAGSKLAANTPRTRPADRGDRPETDRPARSTARGGSRGPAGSRPPGSRAAGSRAAGSKVSGSKPAYSKPTGSKPVGGNPAGGRPADSRPADSRPADSRPADSRPAGSRPAGSRPAGSRPAGNRPAGSRSPGNKPASGRTQAGSRPPERKPPAGKPAARRPAPKPGTAGAKPDKKEPDRD
jgi:pseudouridine synthase